LKKIKANFSLFRQNISVLAYYVTMFTATDKYMYIALFQALVCQVKRLTFPFIIDKIGAFVIYISTDYVFDGKWWA
jgi:hypothetical protein